MVNEPEHKSNIANDVVRISALTATGSNGTFKIGDLKDQNNNDFVSYNKGENGLYKVAIRLPDGTTEFYQQTHSLNDSETGFNAMAFKRCNTDGSTWLDSEGEPRIAITFPGSSGDNADNKTVDRIIAGKDMSHLYGQTEGFLDSVAEDMRKDAETNNHGMGSVITSAYSMGSVALGAGYYLKNEYGIESVNDYALNPFAAGQAVEQLALRYAGKYYGETPTAEEIKNVADGLTANITSIRPDDETVYSKLKLGNEHYDNAMVGRTYRYSSPDGGMENLINMEDHKLSRMAFAAFSQNEAGFTRTKDQDLSGAQILEGGGKLSDMDQIWTQIKRILHKLFMGVMNGGGLSGLFNDAAQSPQQGHEADQDLQADEDRSFLSMEKDITFENKNYSSPGNNIQHDQKLTANALTK